MVKPYLYSGKFMLPAYYLDAWFKEQTVEKKSIKIFKSLSDDTGKKYNFISFRVSVYPEADCVAF